MAIDSCESEPDGYTDAQTRAKSHADNYNGPKRGAIAHWYPYPFIDVTQLGYGRAAVNCIWVALLMLGLAAGATVLDDRIGRAAPAARKFSK